MSRLTCLSLAAAFMATLALPQEAAAQAAPAAEATAKPAPEPSSTATEAPDTQASSDDSATPKPEESSNTPPEEGAQQEPATQEQSVPAAEEAAAKEPAATPPPPTYEDDYAKGDQKASTAALVPREKKESPFVLGLLWDTSLPVGITKDFASKFSARGFSVDGRYRGLGNIGLGVTLAWHVIDVKTNTSAKWRNATITGTQVREISSSPFTFKVSYALRDQKKFIPYAGVGVGAARVLRRVDMGIARVTDESWHFALVPEIGLEIPTKAVVLLASTRFNYFVKTGDAPAQLYMNFSLGVGFE